MQFIGLRVKLIPLRDELVQAAIQRTSLREALIGRRTPSIRPATHLTGLSHLSPSWGARFPRREAFPSRRRRRREPCSGFSGTAARWSSDPCGSSPLRGLVAADRTEIKRFLNPGGCRCDRLMDPKLTFKVGRGKSEFAALRKLPASSAFGRKPRDAGVNACRLLAKKRTPSGQARTCRTSSAAYADAYGLSTLNKSLATCSSPRSHCDPTLSARIGLYS